MANKALGTRQKLTFRIVASQQMPRNPGALAAKQRAAGPHKKTNAVQHQMIEQRLLKKRAEPDQD